LHLLLYLGRPLACAAILAATAWAAGRTVRRRLAGGGEEAPGLDLALGFALLAQLGFFLALAGLFNRASIALTVLVVHGVGLRPRGGWRDLPWGTPAGLRRGAREEMPAGRGGLGGRVPVTRRRVAFVALFALALAPLLVLALYPPTGFDATLYHLPFAKAFLASGGLPILWDLRVPVFPQLAELLFAGAMAFGGELAPHLVELLAALGTAAILVTWGERRWGSGSGWLAAALFLSGPIVIGLGTSAYVDVSLTLMATAAFAVLDQEREPREVLGEEGSAGARGLRLALAGLLAGTAAGIKYQGLFFVAAAVALAFLWAPRRRLVAATLVATGALAALAPTYLHIVRATGNPVFPLFPGLFGATSWSLGNEERVPALGLAFLRWLRLPWDVYFDRGAVGLQPPFSPWFLLGLPILTWGVWRMPRIRPLVAIAGAWSLAFLVLPRDARYLLPILPLIALSLASALRELATRLASHRSVDRATRWQGRRRAATWALVALLFAPGWLYAGFRILRQGALPASGEAREAYLERQLPLYPAIRHLNRTLGAGYALYGLFGEQMRYFVQGRYLGDWAGRAPYQQVIPVLAEPEALHRTLTGFGATHLLWPKTGDRRPPMPRGPAWERLFRTVFEDDGAAVYALESSAALKSRR
jgi:hypothetical protein